MVSKMFAVIETGGKQYKVSEGDVIFVEKIDAEANSEVTFDKVVSVSKRSGSISVGKPYVKDATVTATLLKNGKGKKVTVFTYKPKKDSKRKLGHRQPYSQVRIETINA
jgi:large subunit ribosomal protein L21